MSNQKIGKSADDIFSTRPKPPEEKPAPQEKRGRGRPDKHGEDWSKVTVVLLERQIHWLDKLALDIRKRTKASISRAEIIRAAIEAMEESDIDFTEAESGRELKTLFRKSLRR